MLHSLRLISILGILFFAGLSGLAQEYYFRQYSRDDGLPQSTVRDILQDKEGYIWLATDGGGVVRFDSHKMTAYSVRNGLSDNAISHIIQDSKGNIWLAGLRRGLSRFDGRQFHRYDETNGLTGKGISTLFELENGQIWAGTTNGMILEGNATGDFKERKVKGLQEGNAITQFCRAKDGKIWMATRGSGCGALSSDLGSFGIAPGLPSENVNCMTLSPKGDLWIGTDKGPAVWNGNGFQTPENLQFLKEYYITSIIWLQDGSMCLSSYTDGLFLQVGNTFLHLSSEEGLASPAILSLELDSEGNLWIGSYRGGVNLFLGKEISSLNNKHGLCSDIIRAIQEDQAGNIWFGTYQSGICSYDGLAFKDYGVEEGMPSEMVQAVMPLPSGEIIFGTLNGLALKSDKKIRAVKADLADNFIRCIAMAKDGTLWVGTENGGAAHLSINLEKATAEVLEVLDKVNGKAIPNVRWIQIAENGTMSLATSEGLVVVKGGKQILIDRKQGLPESRLNTVLQDEKGNYWIGCEGGGLVFVAPQHLENPDSFFVFDASNGMEEDNVLSIALDKTDNLWVITESGVQVLNRKLFLEKRQIEFLRFDRNNGYTGHENLRNSIHVDRRGNIWVGTVRGAHIFQNGIVDRQIKAPKVVLDAVQLFRENVDWVSKGVPLDSASGLPMHLVLPYNENHLTFEFTGIHFTNPARVQYRHRLVGFEDNWSKPSNSPIITYSNLSAGRYVFELQAATSQSDWEREPVRFSFRIKPPWYYTWWFITLSLLIVLGLVYAFVSYRTRSVRIFNTQLQAEIEQRKLTEVELLEANRDLDTLLYRTAHDLKAPIATASGMLTIALSEASDDQSKTYLQMIQLSNSKLNQTVDNLLEITHITSRKLEPKQLNLRDMAERAWNSLQEVPEFGKVKFTNLASQEATVFSDPNLLSYILVNLFANSIHYRNRKAGQSTLTFNAEPMGITWLLSISDNGIGMAKNIQEKVFQMFYRGSDQADGTGLGLYVVRKGVHRLGGSISLESEPGQGSTFRIKLGNLGSDH